MMFQSTWQRACLMPQPPRSAARRAQHLCHECSAYSMQEAPPREAPFRKRRKEREEQAMISHRRARADATA